MTEKIEQPERVESKSAEGGAEGRARLIALVESACQRVEAIQDCGNRRANPCGPCDSQLRIILSNLREAASLLGRPVLPSEDVWRCFHCEEVFTTRIDVKVEGNYRVTIVMQDAEMLNLLRDALQVIDNEADGPGAGEMSARLRAFLQGRG